MRIAIDGPGDDPDEYWFECAECEGSGTVSVPCVEDGDEGVYVVEGVYVAGTCPVRGGLGR